MAWEVLTGDCIEEMAKLEDCSVDAVVCDPPYGIRFMGAAWDAVDIEDLNRVQASKRERPDGRTSMDSPAGAAGTYDLSLTANRRFQAWCEAWTRECLRVLKPGGHLLACGGSRTHHRLVSGIEDAGFEIRDRIDCPDGRKVETPDGTLAWYFGSGFPKSADVHKALTKWADRVRAGWLQAPYDSPAADRKLAELSAVVAELEAPVEDEEWRGFGTALKPAHEPIVVARKPLIGTVAQNVLEHHAGGLNIGACRIAGAGAEEGRIRHGGGSNGVYAQDDWTQENQATMGAPMPSGRWPANVVMSHSEDCVEVGTRLVRGDPRETGNGRRGGGFADIGAHSGDGEPNAVVYGDETITAWKCVPGCPVATLDEQSGELKSGFMAAGTQREGIGYQGGPGSRVRNDTHGDSGGASRFFYTAKTSRAERNAGLDDFPDVEGGFRSETSGQHLTRRDGGDPGPTKNNHPTVKPINLMRWLVRLITPPDGLVLDPFTGSGSTGCAAVLEGFDFLGIEREPKYVAIAEARIAFWAQHEGREVEDVLGQVNRSKAETKKHLDNGQGSLLELATTYQGEED